MEGPGVGGVEWVSGSRVDRSALRLGWRVAWWMAMPGRTAYVHHKHPPSQARPHTSPSQAASYAAGLHVPPSAARLCMLRAGPQAGLQAAPRRAPGLGGGLYVL